MPKENRKKRHAKRKIRTQISPIFQDDQVQEVAGLKNWLKMFRLSKHYDFFSNLSFDQIVELTERHVFHGVCADLIEPIMVYVDVLKKAHNRCIKLQDRLLKGNDIPKALSKLDLILPSQFTPLIGPLPSLFVNLMQTVYYRIFALEPLKVREECETTFYQLVLRANLNHSFNEDELFSINKWRKVYQAQRKLMNQNKQKENN